MKVKGTMGAATEVHLNCPRCGLTITPRTQWLTIGHCPRCLGRDRIAVEMFRSLLPVDELYAEGTERTGPALRGGNRGGWGASPGWPRCERGHPGAARGCSARLAAPGAYKRVKPVLLRVGLGDLVCWSDQIYHARFPGSGFVTFRRVQPPPALGVRTFITV